MALRRLQIEHFEYWWKKSGNMDKSWRILSHSRKWLKKQLNKYIRIRNKHIEENDIGFKQGRKPFNGWEY